ncbi:hypothetical protein [Profundibacter amoris]|uniref:Uncharacterized protein n=1 Tax=Profundibacter amoris TaxID=2171755 RepID=A0A347UG21_9RHOB|nr:hypothetical protein [Profundibacter amoris]AXX97799.1 hypothetical protein BAR1_07560 [Profundibacter amoris]
MSDYKWMVDALFDMAAFAEKNKLQKSYDSLVNSLVEVMIEIGPTDHIEEDKLLGVGPSSDNVIALPI